MSDRARRFSTEAYVENKRRCALVKGVLNSLTRGLWAQGVNLVQQMYITQTYRRDNGMDSDEEVVEIPDDELKALKKKAKRAAKAMGQRK